MASSAVKAVTDMDGVRLVIVLTETGGSARYVAKYRPSVPVLTMTSVEQSYRQLLISQSVWPLLCDPSLSDKELMQKGIKHAVEHKWVKPGDWVVVVSGSQGIQGSAHTMNIIQVKDESG